MLLSRTAENLFWLARYMERAETVARLLGVGARTSLMPNTGGRVPQRVGIDRCWPSGTEPAFRAKYGEVR